MIPTALLIDLPNGGRDLTPADVVAVLADVATRLHAVAPHLTLAMSRAGGPNSAVIAIRAIADAPDPSADLAAALDVLDEAERIAAAAFDAWEAPDRREGFQ